MRWRKCSNCGARWRALDYFAPLTRQASEVCRRLYFGFSVHPVHGVRLCHACVIELT